MFDALSPIVALVFVVTLAVGAGLQRLLDVRGERRAAQGRDDLKT